MAATNPSPKQRFMQDPTCIKAHKALVDRMDFQMAADHALMQYQSDLATQRVDMGLAAANHFKITGALEFLQTFRNLAETVNVPARQDTDNLKHS